MKTILFLLPLAVIAALLAADYAGYAGGTAGGFTGSVAGGGEGDALGALPAGEVAPLPEVPAAGGGQEAPIVHLDVSSVETDKGLYHSAETMKITAVVAADGDAPGATVTAAGIRGKMSLSETVDLVPGDNAVEFTYQLPRCNVCGGIPAGNYTCTVSASYGSSSSSKDFTVDVRQ